MGKIQTFFDRLELAQARILIHFAANFDPQILSQGSRFLENFDRVRLCRKVTVYYNTASPNAFTALLNAFTHDDGPVKTLAMADVRR